MIITRTLENENDRLGVYEFNICWIWVFSLVQRLFVIPVGFKMTRVGYMYTSFPIACESKLRTTNLTLQYMHC